MIWSQMSIVMPSQNLHPLIGEWNLGIWVTATLNLPPTTTHGIMFTNRAHTHLSTQITGCHTHKIGCKLLAILDYQALLSMGEKCQKTRKGENCYFEEQLTYNDIHQTSVGSLFSYHNIWAASQNRCRDKMFLNWKSSQVSYKTNLLYFSL